MLVIVGSLQPRPVVTCGIAAEVIVIKDARTANCTKASSVFLSEIMSYNNDVFFERSNN